MGKLFGKYAIAWLIVLIIFNIVCFALPNEFMGYTKFDATFWTAYIFMTLAFIGQLICAAQAFKAENAKKLFYNIPLITISYTGLILMLIFGAIIITIPDLPNWVGIILCVLILGFTAVAVIKASAAVELVEQVDEKVKTQTSFIRNMTAEAESLMARAKSMEAKEACKKVYEALRYSDPVSNDALSVVEAKITVKIDELSNAIGADNAGAIKEIADELIDVIGDRNIRCKALKG